ncbi:LPS export ABC transporter periplasmic protein LptC [Candidatus Pelagibacter communis]|uniref:LPS export ABC transporter periplasmic protein LptC n=1 Tax=Pelagibacter ubique TaxID=198252 RepID=UPI00094DD2ED|nr:LPS export ABC transporter periplasmic protein LptC [Candidatus Pelagibacter ubique]
MRKIIILAIILSSITISYKLIEQHFDKKNLPIDLDENYIQNIIENVEYKSQDSKGNKFIIRAETGEIDYNKDNIIYLTNVSAKIILTNSQDITITSDFGKYDNLNYDTIFSKNVIIKYLENNIKSDYMDFSINRNTMIISKNVVYSNLENVIKADVLEIKIDSKDAKIFMYKNKDKVKMKSKNYNGNN